MEAGGLHLHSHVDGQEAEFSAPAEGFRKSLGSIFAPRRVLTDSTSYDLPNRFYLNVFETFFLVLTNL